VERVRPLQLQVEGSRLCGRDRQGRGGGGVTLYVRDRFDGAVVIGSDDAVEALRVSSRRVENKRDVVVGVCYRSPCWDVGSEEVFRRPVAERSGSIALVLTGDVNFLGISRRSSILLWRAGVGNSQSL